MLWLALTASLAAPPEATDGEDPGAASSASETGEVDEEAGAEARRRRRARGRQEARDEVDPEVREIEVSTGTRTSRDAATTPVATTVVSREDIVNSGAETLDEVLEQQGAGVQTSPGVGGVGVTLRGFNPEQVLITIDGQRVTGRIGGVVDLSRLTVENIERIEIVQGAGSVLQGSDAVGGVINIITRKPDDGVQAEAHGAYGSRNTIDATGRVAGGMRRWQASLTGGLHRSDGWDASPEDEATTGDAFQAWNVGAGVHVQPLSALRIDLTGSYLRRNSEGVDVTNGGAILDRRNLTETTDATLATTWIDGDSQLQTTLHTNIFRDQFRQDQRGDDALDQYQPTWDQVLQVGAQYDQIVGKHVLTTGVDLQFEWLRTDRLEVELGGSGPDNDRAQRNRAALFVQDEWVPSTAPRITVLPALRLDFDSQFGIYPTGRLALLVAPLDELSFRVSYGRGYRAPSFRELYLAFANAGVGYRVQGNPSLRPEQAWTLNVGVSYLPTKNLTFTASVFDNQLRDLMTVDLVAEGGANQLQVFSYVNVGTATLRGVEGTADVRFAKYFGVEGSYQFLHARQHGSDQPLPNRPAHQTTFGFRFFHGRWGTRASVRGRIQGQRAFSVTEDSAEFADPFATIDVRVSQRFLRYVTAFVGAENLLDAGDAVVNRIAPRSFYGGINVRY